MSDFIIQVIDMCTIEDLMNGYIYDDNHRVFTCLFCGEIYEEDLIYKCEGQLCNARKAIEIHILKEHNSSFDFLLGLGKKYTGLSDRQKEIFEIFHNEKDNQFIAEKMGTTPATVRSYKFKMKEKLRQAKIYLAISNLIELENSNDKTMEVDSIGDIAIYEKLKRIEKAIKEIDKDNEVEELINKKFGGLNLNFMNKFTGSRRPDMK